MQQVEIRVKGQIDERWSEWLGGFDYCPLWPTLPVLDLTDRLFQVIIPTSW
jgi:hypothetical protein